MTAALAVIMLAISVFLFALGCLLSGQLGQVLKVLGTAGAGASAVILIVLEV